jgi:hypothetical protein
MNSLLVVSIGLQTALFMIWGGAARSLVGLLPPAIKLNPANQAVTSGPVGFSLRDRPFPSVPGDSRQKPFHSNPLRDLFPVVTIRSKIQHGIKLA